MLLHPIPQPLSVGSSSTIQSELRPCQVLGCYKYAKVGGNCLHHCSSDVSASSNIKNFTEINKPNGGRFHSTLNSNLNFKSTTSTNNQNVVQMVPSSVSMSIISPHISTTPSTSSLPFTLNTQSIPPTSLPSIPKQYYEMKKEVVPTTTTTTTSFSNGTPLALRLPSLHKLVVEATESFPYYSSQNGNSIKDCRRCRHKDCMKFALKGGFCTVHGGGNKCSFPNCDTTAQSHGLCKLHGGGSRCKYPGCEKVARYRQRCVKHGGRYLCKKEGCNRCAHRGGFCISHGGGRRCGMKGCPKSAQSGGYCYAHGGGKRCAVSNCSHAARNNGYCKSHAKEFNGVSSPIASTDQGKDPSLVSSSPK